MPSGRMLWRVPDCRPVFEVYYFTGDVRHMRSLLPDGERRIIRARYSFIPFREYSRRFVAINLLHFTRSQPLIRKTIKMEEKEIPKRVGGERPSTVLRRIVELGSPDQKAHGMVKLEGLLLALIAVFSTSISNNSLARAATWASMILLLASAVSSLMVRRIRYGTKIIASAPNIEDGLRNMRKWRDNKLRFHNAT